MTKTGKAINNHLNGLSSKDLCLRTDKGWLTPNDKFNALYLLRHMSKHYANEGITIKSIVDWGLFLKKRLNNNHSDDIISMIQNYNMVKSWDLFTTLASKVLDCDFTNSLIEREEDILADSLFIDLFKCNDIDSKSDILPIRLYKKIKKKMSKKWVYDMGILPDDFWSEIVFGAIYAHIKMPQKL